MWSELFDDGCNTRKQADYLSEAQDFGLIDGLGVPIVGLDRSYSMLSMASSEPIQLLRDAIGSHTTQLITLGLAFHCLSQSYVLERFTQARAMLSPRERECLLWVMRGKSSWEIAQIIRTTERTVVFHIENAKKKLGVTSRSHAAVKAITEGHIAP